MKARLLLFFILLLIGVTMKAQKIEMVSKNLPAYEGTWQYATPTDTFTLVLKKELSVNETRTKECLTGLYYYKKNGQVLNNYLSSEHEFSLSDKSKKQFPIYATNADYKNDYDKINPNVVRVTFYDYNQSKNKQGSAKIELVVGKPNEAVWIIVYRKREVVNVEGLPDITPSKPVYVLPDTMVLKKIK